MPCSANEPCPVYLELSSVEVVGPKLFVTGNLHTDTATLDSMLLATEDGGKSWTEPHPRIRNGALEQIQFLDFEMGWVGGHILQGIPRNPFLLITRDGGKTWRAAPITEDERAGSIDQFWFDSRTAGTLLIDRLRSATNGARYELYESMTGGESWSLKEASSRPIQTKRARPTGNPDWRLRADTRSKSYHLERKQGAAWTVVAAFPIRVGECRAKEPVLAEPEPEPEPEQPAAPETQPAKRPAKKPTLQKKRPPA
jgi:photosystem II stability/assembly factor-like uncharacterized protein